MSRIDDLVAQLCPRGVEHKSLGELGEFIRGNGLQKKDLTDDGIGAIHYGQIHTHYGTSATETTSFVSEALAMKLRKAKVGDLVIATTSEDDDAVGKAVAWLGQKEVAVSSDAYIYRHSLNPTYLSYFFQSNQFRAQKRRFITGTKVRRLSGDGLAKIRIAVPPLAIQEQIGRTLTRMEELEGALEATLEAELEARRQQHEHYGDLLLTFSPETVQWAPLGDVVSNLDSQRRPVTRSARRSGPFPYYGANGVQDYVDDFIFDGTFLLIGEDGSVVRKDRAPVVNWASGKIWVNNHAHVLGERAEVANLRFLYFYLQTIDITPYVTGGTQQKLNQGNLNRVSVPLPPLEEQARTVEILDKFEALMTDLSSEIPAELSARRQQYEYYRDRLLAFPEAA
ncbi:MAG TPA: restriction endonuclease subunit S [Gaiellaceae bacterium]|nr:restriction endonuclease subunit S [Gaiellaceae bacterium]